MTTQLNFSATANPVSALVGAGLTDAKAAPVGGDSGAGGRFAELFTGQMLKLERQGLATVQDGLGSLQMMPLGQTMNVITSDAPVPDIHSLLAFAKAQGLDDLAVAGLFGEMPATPQGVPMPMPMPQGAPTPMLMPQGISATALSPAEQKSTVALDAVSSLVQPPDADLLQSVGEVTITGLQVMSKQTVADFGRPPPDEVGPRVQEGVPVAPAMALNLALSVQSVLPAVRVIEVSAAPVDVNPPMVDALRVQMGIPSEAITRRLAQMSGSKTSLSWAELVAKAANKTDAGSLTGAAGPFSTASATGASPEAAVALGPMPGMFNTNGAAATNTATLAASASALRFSPGDNGERSVDGLLQSKLVAAPQVQEVVSDTSPLNFSEETLTVDIPAGLDLGALADQSGAPATAEASGPRQSAAPAAAQSPQTAAEATRAAIQERAAQTQLLADRMGQALANRLISQIERGQWKLQLHMQPAALGRVDVALDMHAGGLDAVFRTDNAFTQDLLGQGAQRLREALTQAGTTVASVTVHADARGQSGGNSTPQKRQPSPKQSAAPAAVGAVPAKAARYTGGVAEGLNVLA